MADTPATPVPQQDPPAGSVSADEAPTAASAPARDPAEGKHIGPYRILQKLGEGGMGIVYLAEQQQPIRRRVALKVIKQGMDTQQVVARFEAERQALALMSHPHIAQVFDAGSTEAGRPYFAMEYVPGVPITNYCDTHRLTAPQRLELFVHVCEALQHAHQKGIIHRDIKASNVLVSVEGERPIAKVIDFGVAKAISQKLTERTLYTEHGIIIGTPEYMSPEQAEVNPLDIDTRSDIYSLGVLLYELLTGVLPFDPEELRQCTWGEMQRTIKEVDPPTLGQRLRGLGENARPIAAARRTTLAELDRLLRSDVDWIVAKTLEKDRTRRYSSAAELAADIRRHLDDERVLARPPSTAYRLAKVARRHRAAVAGGVALIVLIAALFAASLLTTEQRMNRTEQYLFNVSFAAAKETDTLLDRAGAAARSSESDQVILTALQRGDDLSADDRARLAGHLDVLASAHAIFDLILVVDAQGTVVASNTRAPPFDASYSAHGGLDGPQPFLERVPELWGNDLAGFADEAEWLDPVLRGDVDGSGVVKVDHARSSLMGYLLNDTLARLPTPLPEYTYYLRYAAPVMSDGRVVGAICYYLPWRHFQHNIYDRIESDFDESPAAVGSGYAFVWDTDGRTIIGHADRAIYYTDVIDDHGRTGLYDAVVVRGVSTHRYEYPIGVPKMAGFNRSRSPFGFAWYIGVGTNLEDFGFLAEARVALALALAALLAVGAIATWTITRRTVS